jgi:hypothetical protein
VIIKTAASAIQDQHFTNKRFKIFEILLVHPSPPSSASTPQIPQTMARLITDDHTGNAGLVPSFIIWYRSVVETFCHFFVWKDAAAPPRCLPAPHKQQQQMQLRYAFRFVSELVRCVIVFRLVQRGRRGGSACSSTLPPRAWPHKQQPQTRICFSTREVLGYRYSSTNCFKQLHKLNY